MEVIQAGLLPSLTQQTTPYRPGRELERGGLGSLVPEKMTGQSLRTQSIRQKQPQLFRTTSLIPMEQPTTRILGGPSKEGVPQESGMDAR